MENVYISYMYEESSSDIPISGGSSLSSTMITPDVIDGLLFRQGRSQSLILNRDGVAALV